MQVLEEAARTCFGHRQLEPAEQLLPPIPNLLVWLLNLSAAQLHPPRLLLPRCAAPSGVRGLGAPDLRGRGTVEVGGFEVPVTLPPPIWPSGEDDWTRTKRGRRGWRVEGARGR